MKLSVVLVILSAWHVQTLKILGVFHMPAKSHYILGSRLMTELANRGHDVTVISPFGEKNPPKNYKDIVLTGIENILEDHRKNNNMFSMVNMNRFLKLFFMNQMGCKVTEKVFEHEKVQKLLKSDEKFDVVVVEQFINDAHKYFCYHYKAPCVMFSTVGSGSWTNHLVGNPAPLSYIPDIFLSYSGKMSFWQRVENVYVSFISYLNRKLLFMPNQNKILKKFFPDAPHVDELNTNVSLVLLNSHVSTHQPVPHVPNMIEIGGFHLSPPKPLPKDLQDYLDSAKNGVVYFSMGSNLRSAALPVEKRDAILKTFAKLKENVLWKWEEDVLPGQPQNVRTGKWLPQQDILAHPNVKLFITHGGLLSTTETIYHGKPIVAIPIFGDQKMNAKAAVLNGFGIALNFDDLNEETFTSALKEALTNPKYGENAKIRSKLMHDRPIKPIDSAVYWVEYAVRHKGASHFKSAALDLYWFQYYLVDVLAFFVVVALGVLYVCCAILKKICNKRRIAKMDNKKKRN